jgi:xanthine dehydrogenase YagS FAD-binding subunit
MCVALAALEATAHVAGPAGARTIAFADFHRLPGTTPQRDTNLEPDEIITAIELPPKGFSANYSYLKIRDRLSYAFALVSVAAALELDGDTIKEARLALGGVAHKPWRSSAAEIILRGERADASAFARAADILLRGAKGYGHNNFKIGLARRAIVRTLGQAARGTPQSLSDKKIR